MSAPLDDLSIPMLDCTPLPDRGTIRIVGSGIPTGHYTIQRQVTPASPWEDLRGGGADVSTGGFVREDTEPPFGSEVLYRVQLTMTDPADRYIQRNLVLTPSFGAAGAAPPATVHAGPSRVLSQVFDPLAGHAVGAVTANEAGGNQGVPGRTIVEFEMAQLTAGVEYQITGKIRYTTLAINRWADVAVDYQNWQNLLDSGKTWEDLYGEAGDEIFTRIYLSISSGTTNYTQPVLVRSPQPADIDTWIPFSARLIMPAGIPATARIRIFHGDGVSEYSATWRLDEFSAMPMAEVGPTFFYWFNGVTPPHDNPPASKWPGTNFKALTLDSSIAWEGTALASTSLYRGPSQITAEVACQIDGPDVNDTSNPVNQCNPIFLNDPIQPRLGQWFGLLGIEGIAHVARRDMYSVIQRASQIAVNDLRQWPTGTMRALTTTTVERKMALALFSTGRIIQFRNPDLSIPEGNEDGPWYITMGDVAEVRPFADHRRPERLWEFSWTRVERPKGLIDASSNLGNTWQNVRDQGAWGAIRSNYQNWMGVLLNPQPVDTTNAALPGVLPTVMANLAWQEEKLPEPVGGQ